MPRPIGCVVEAAAPLNPFGKWRRSHAAKVKNRWDYKRQRPGQRPCFGRVSATLRTHGLGDPENIPSQVPR
jgi:hypothetical protein